MIGTSLGTVYDSVFAMHTQRYLGNDNNVIDPVTTPDLNTNDPIDIKPNSDPGILDSLQVEVKNKPKDTMPFPDNKNPDSDFNSRFGNLPPSGHADIEDRRGNNQFVEILKGVGAEVGAAIDDPIKKLIGHNDNPIPPDSEMGDALGSRDIDLSRRK